MSHATKKAAIDCTGYRKEMDNMVDLIIAGVEKDDDIIEEFIELQHAQEMLWMQFLEKNYDFPPM